MFSCSSIFFRLTYEMVIVWPCSTSHVYPLGILTWIQNAPLALCCFLAQEEPLSSFVPLDLSTFRQPLSEQSSQQPLSSLSLSLAETG